MLAIGCPPTRSSAPIATFRARLASVAPWLVGLAAGVLVVGPGLGPGSFLNLDLVLAPQFPVPPGVWGLGPALPQRVPLGVFMAWLSVPFGAPVMGKVLLVALVAIATAGAARLADRAGAGLTTRLGAGLLYGLSPFVITRASIGHWHVLLVAAVLPWALPRLVRPADSLASTFLWAAALAMGGGTGAVVGGVLVVVGLVADRPRPRRAAAVLAVFAAAQAPWVVPAAVARSGGAGVAGAAAFRTQLGSPAGLLRLVVGGGFWRAPSQIGGGLAQAVLGAVVLALALAGTRALPDAWGRRAEAAALVGGALAAVTGIPIVRAPYEAFTRTSLGAPLRDGQRAVVLVLVWAAPAAALGAQRAARSVRPLLAPAVLAVPAVVALLAAAPGLWGARGAFDRVEFPGDWSQARALIRQEPGPVVSFPWHEYVDIPFAGDRRVLDPLADYFGGDVISSFDPEVGAAHQEQVDTRAEGMDAVALSAIKGDPIGAQLASRGVRWVALSHAADWRLYDSLGRDPGLELVSRGPTLDLYRVRDWPGSLVGADGQPVAADAPIAPVRRLPAGAGPVRWYRQSSGGWYRGLTAATPLPGGGLEFPGTSRLIWYAPAVLTVGADFAVLIGVVGAAAFLRRRGNSQVVSRRSSRTSRIEGTP